MSSAVGYNAAGSDLLDRPQNGPEKPLLVFVLRPEEWVAGLAEAPVSIGVLQYELKGSQAQITAHCAWTGN